MNDLNTFALLEQHRQRLRELQEQRSRHTRPVRRNVPPTFRRYQRQR